MPPGGGQPFAPYLVSMTGIVSLGCARVVTELGRLLNSLPIVVTLAPPSEVNVDGIPSCRIPSCLHTPRGAGVQCLMLSHRLGVRGGLIHSWKSMTHVAHTPDTHTPVHMLPL